MTKSLRVAIVEDEALIAESIAIQLRKMGHEVVAVYSNYDAVVSALSCQEAELFLIDIRLKGARTGLDVARTLQRKQGPPFLFVTSNTDSDTVREAMETLPLGYITKPVSYEDLFIGLELVKAKISLAGSNGRQIEVRNGQEKDWIQIKSIQFLEAGRSYVTIHLAEGQRVLRRSLGNFIKDFRGSEIIRIHRSYAVNPRMVESVMAGKVIVAGHKLPLGPGYRDHFLRTLHQLKV